ncbi:hypothetical protein PV326_011299, partial [Microctonus aethiopoides]
MSSTIVELFEKWNMSLLLPDFEERNIGLEELKCISVSEIEEIICSPRLSRQFLAHWKMEFQTNEVASPSIVEDNVNIDRSYSVEELSSTLENCITNNIDVVDENHDSHINENGKRCVSHPHPCEPPLKIRDRDSCTIYTLLQSSSTGRSILAEYNRKKQLSVKASHDLCDIIISEYLVDGNTKLDTNQYLDFKSPIKSIFPEEDSNIYNWSPIPKRLSIFNTSEKARGRLYEKFRNKIKLFRTRSGWQPKKNIFDTSAEDIFQDDELHSVEWLNHNQEYGDDLRRHWEISSRVRYEKLLKSKGSVLDYYNQYPALANKFGYQLIAIDFDRLYKVVETDIYKKWPIFFDNLFTLATVQQKKSVEEIISDLENCTSNYHKIFLQIWVLPFLVPPKTRKIVERPEGRKQWKPTIKECQSSIIVHAT